MKKYGVENFIFEVIAACKSQDDANELETLLVEQYQSHISTGNGYNVSAGGSNAPKTEQWKQQLSNWHTSLSDEDRKLRSKKLSEWHASLSEEERKLRSQKLSVSYTKYLKEHDHPCQGKKWTPEQRKKHSQITSISNKKGRKQSKETIEKRVAAVKATIKKRQELATQAGELKCNAPNCEINGPVKYIFVNNIRYCLTHGKRFKRNGVFDKLPPFKYTPDNPMPDEVRKKISDGKKGQKPHNRYEFTKEQIKAILDDPRGTRKVAVDFGVSRNVIKRVIKEYKQK